MAGARCVLGADWLALRGNEFVAPVQSSYNAATPEPLTFLQCSCFPCPSFLGFFLGKTATRMWNSNGGRAGGRRGVARVCQEWSSLAWEGRARERGRRPDPRRRLMGGRGIAVAGTVGTAFARYRVGERSAAQPLTTVVHHQADSKASAAPPMAERAATRSPPVASGRPHRRRRRRNQYVD